MKNLVKLSLFVLLASSTMSCFGQYLVVQHNSQEQVLYRGFENSIAISLGTTPIDELTFKCVECEIIDRKDGNLIIKTGNSKTATLVASSKLDPSKEFKQTFKVQNLPAPMVFVGQKEAGSEITLDELKSPLSIHYNNCLLLKSNFQIVDWEICVDGLCETGMTQTFSEKAIDLVKKGRENECYQFEC